jgi:amidase
METASEIAAAVRARKRTAVEVAREHLARIAEYDQRLGAFVAVREDEVLAAAEAVDASPERERLPLAGVPVAIKDNVDVAGYATRHGSAAYPNVPVAEDDELVRRLRQAGAVVIGKTKLPELAIWPFTEPEAFGIACNPWNRDRTPGGSTGGGAAAVACGMAALALGSDGGGSIRIPSACCGVFGLKPAPGVVPLAGGASSHWLGLSAFGPIGRTVADAALMWGVLSGSAPEAVGQPPPELRFAISTRHAVAGARVSAEVKRTVRDTADMLRADGHHARDSDPPYPADLGLRFIGRWLAGIAEDAGDLAPALLEPRTRGMARAGRFVQRRGWAPPADRDPFGAAMQRWFADFDVLVMPTLASTAVPVRRWRGGWLRTALGSANWVMTAQWNLAGIAAASVPAGLGENGLPLAVQLVAPAGRERLLLEVAARLEARRPFPQWSQDRL